MNIIIKKRICISLRCDCSFFSYHESELVESLCDINKNKGVQRPSLSLVYYLYIE